MDDAPPSQLVDIEERVAELEQPGTELVFLGVGILLHEAVDDERLEQPVDGGTRKPEPIRQLTDPKALRSTGQGLQYRRRPVNGLDRGTSVFIRHC